MAGCPVEAIPALCQMFPVKTGKRKKQIGYIPSH